LSFLSFRFSNSVFKGFFLSLLFCLSLPFATVILPFKDFERLVIHKLRQKQLISMPITHNKAPPPSLGAKPFNRLRAKAPKLLLARVRKLNTKLE